MFASNEKKKTTTTSCLVFSLPPGERDENGDLPNTAAADLALALAYALGIKWKKN